MDINEFVTDQLQKQAYHVRKQLERLAERRGTSVDDLASIMCWQSGLAQDTVLKLTRSESPKLPGTVHNLQKMADGIACDLRLTVFPIDDNNRQCPGSQMLTQGTAPMGRVASLLRHVRHAAQLRSGHQFKPSSLETGIHSPTFAGAMRALAILGYKVRIYLVER